MKRMVTPRAVVAIVLLLAACGRDGGGSLPDAVKVQTMENVVEISLGTVSDLAETYYGTRPSQLVPMIVENLIAANSPPSEVEMEGMSEEEKQMMQKVWVPSFVANTPTEPWQVVVRADDDRAVIILEGYGDDLSHPLITREELVVTPRPEVGREK